jgi:hypothetical protein
MLNFDNNYLVLSSNIGGLSKKKYPYNWIKFVITRAL